MAAPAFDVTTRVETPEHVAFTYRLAGPAQRVAAYVFDVVLRVMAFALLMAVAGLWTMLVGGVKDALETQGALALLAWFALEWFWGVGFEWLWDGRTPGKRVFGLRVIRQDGRPISLREALLRNLLRAADMLPPMAGLLPTYGVGVAVMLADQRFRRLGDLAAGTIVVREEPVHIAADLVVEPAPTATELATLPTHLLLRLGERRLLDALLRRAHHFPPARRAELARPWADHLARRFGRGSPPDAMRFLQLVYVRSASQTFRGPR